MYAFDISAVCLYEEQLFVAAIAVRLVSPKNRYLAFLSNSLSRAKARTNAAFGGGGSIKDRAKTSWARLVKRMTLPFWTTARAAWVSAVTANSFTARPSRAAAHSKSERSSGVTLICR